MATGTIQIPIDRTNPITVNTWTHGTTYLVVDNRLKLAWISFVGNDASISGRPATNFSIAQYCMPAMRMEANVGGTSGFQLSIYKDTSGVPDGQVYIYKSAKYQSMTMCFPIE